MNRIVLILLFLSCLFSPITCFGQVTITMERHGGVYYVPGKVNGLSMKFIFDTGASNVCLSLTEAMFMLKNGYIKESDFGEKCYSQIANGDVVENLKITLRNVEIGGVTIKDVDAIVSKNLDAPLLLGQSAIRKLGPIQLNGSTLTIGNKENILQEEKVEPKNNLGKTIIELRQLFPDVYYVRTEDKGDFYTDGEGEITNFFYLKNNRVVEEGMIIQSVDEFSSMFYIELIESFSNYAQTAAFRIGVNHMCFSTFSTHLMFFVEHGKNTVLLFYQEGGINNGITYNEFINKWNK